MHPKHGRSKTGLGWLLHCVCFGPFGGRETVQLLKIVKIGIKQLNIPYSISSRTGLECLYEIIPCQCQIFWICQALSRVRLLVSVPLSIGYGWGVKDVGTMSFHVSHVRHNQNSLEINRSLSKRKQQGILTSKSWSRASYCENNGLIDLEVN